ncbi:hypothetical protein RND81_14G132900 [Saponaria officinalis]|uniref:Cellulose synthase (UDP-forming) n=1 Tax=Saponaria officinalis TaxID=3572 RepID=A0AAW1GPT5_SAPOF
MKCYDIKPLNHFHVHKKWTFFNRTHMFLHFLALLITFYYRASFFFKKNYLKYKMVEFLAWLLILVSELMLAFIWVLRQPYYWRPITRTVLPKNLPKDDDLPGIDVFICTADADKEPTFDVMNTVISAMALDYPPHKLHVYLSDDAGTSVTLDGLKDAWVFTTWWLPFCRRYDVKPPCPRAFFEETEKEGKSSEMCIKDRKHIKVYSIIFFLSKVTFCCCNCF